MAYGSTCILLHHKMASFLPAGSTASHAWHHHEKKCDDLNSKF